MRAVSALCSSSHNILAPTKPWTPQALIQSRHLLRALLRQASFLPDSQARAYIHTYILNRWRTHMNSAHNDEKWLIQRWAEGNKKLRWLQRANAGETNRLRYVLLLSYGRIGKRRHKLLAPLLDVTSTVSCRPTHPQASEEDAPGHAVSDATRVTDKLYRNDWKANSPTLSDELRALLSSQIKSSPRSVRVTPKTQEWLNLKIPERNMWGRSMPIKRRQNMVIKWYHDLCERALPPLPTREWKRLRDLAMGFAVDLKNEMKMDERRERHMSALSSGDERRLVDMLPIGRGISSKALRSKPRIMHKTLQRAWLHVFEQCCYMEWDAQTNKWKVVWGSDYITGHYRHRATLNATNGT